MMQLLRLGALGGLDGFGGEILAAAAAAATDRKEDIHQLHVFPRLGSPSRGEGTKPSVMSSLSTFQQVFEWKLRRATLHTTSFNLKLTYLETILI